MKSFIQALSRPVAAGALALSLIVAPAAFANNDNDRAEKVRKAGTAVEVQIGQNGRTLVRGAVVTAVASSSLTATTNWGSSNLTWQINTTGAEFIQVGGGKKLYSIADIAVGDVISFSGTLNTGVSGLAVDAKVVKNWTKKTTPPPSMNDTFQGTLQSLASTTLPTSLVLKIGNTNYTVNASSSTIVIGANWLPTTLSTFQIGDTVRIFGSISASENTHINALVIRNASR